MIVEEMKKTTAAITAGLAIRPVIHLAALQEIQPVLTTDDNTSKHHLIKC
jgi:hypothetical protein